MKVLVSKVNRFDFNDEKTGKNIKGAKLHYLPLDKAPSTSDSSGEETIPVSIPYDEFSVYHGNVPCIASLEVTLQRSGKNFKPKYIKSQIVKKIDWRTIPGVNG